MSLSDLWLTSRAQLKDKQVHQIVAFARTGQLNDGGPASREFREFLSLVSSEILEAQTNISVSPFPVAASRYRTLSIKLDGDSATPEVWTHFAT